MKGLLSFVLFSIAFVQMTGAAPVAGENSSGISLVALILSYVSTDVVTYLAVSKRGQKQFACTS